MRFGINFFPSFLPEQKSGAQYFAECLNLAERADQLGFASVRIVEHHFKPYGGASPNPIVFLSAASQRAPHVRLVTGAVVPAFNHPLKYAGELAMLDCISNGRLDAGFARAFLPDEFEAFGVAMEDSRARYEEGIAACVRLWTEANVTFHGRFHSFENVSLLPRPVQKPHPPVWIAAIGTPQSFEWAGQMGYNLMFVPYVSDFQNLAKLIQLYRDSWKAAGHPPGQERVAFSAHCYVAESRAEALRGVRPGWEQYHGIFYDRLKRWVGHPSPQYKGYDEIAALVDRFTFEQMIDERRLYVGTPDEVAEQFAYTRELFGDAEPSVQVNFGNLSEADGRRSLELLAQYVLPRFADASAPASPA
ncbi:MAG TPA: LLM class flavin-dependent oxidoreductase [Chloroflexota bacterium]|jgi:natural product biosynthesis luciferase-like monooxygenase protein